MRQLRAPIVDAIDKRNYQNDIKKSVVKRSNVNYVSMPVTEANATPDTGVKEELSEVLPKQEHDDGAVDKAAEIMARLEMEAKEDEIAKTQEWTKKLLEEKPKEEIDHLYNSATQSYSGTYGQGPMDETSKRLADEILHEKDKQRNTIIQQNL